jgi:hypothetical protein
VSLTLREILADDGFEDSVDVLYPPSGDADDDVEAEALRLRQRDARARKPRPMAPSNLFDPHHRARK